MHEWFSFFRECKYIKNIFEDVYFTKNSFHITLSRNYAIMILSINYAKFSKFMLFNIYNCLEKSYTGSFICHFLFLLEQNPTNSHKGNYIFENLKCCSFLKGSPISKELNDMESLSMYLFDIV